MGNFENGAKKGSAKADIIIEKIEQNYRNDFY